MKKRVYLSLILLLFLGFFKNIFFTNVHANQIHIDNVWDILYKSNLNKEIFDILSNLENCNPQIQIYKYRIL